MAVTVLCGPGSSVGIATDCGLNGAGIESRWGRDFPHLSRPALRPTQPPVQWVPGLFRGKDRPKRDADPSPPSSAAVMEEYSYTSTPHMVRTACIEPQCLYSTAIPLLPYGPYGLYRASVPVQYSYTSTSPTDRTACTEPQCLYKDAPLPYLYLFTN